MQGWALEISRIGIIGVGLIGGSIARAARANGYNGEIVGFDCGAANLEKALRLGVIDRIADTLPQAAEQADLVVIATPVGATEAVFAALRPVWSDSILYTDVGSTKLDVMTAAQRCLGRIPGNFIPGHPIAGAESSGVEAADEKLFINKRVILTPNSDADGDAVKRISEFWTGLGASVSTMGAAHHDAVLAASSHLPHVLAFALVHMLGRKNEQEAIFRHAAGGFRDFTRIASSDPRMWADICLANKANILPLLADLSSELLVISEIMNTDNHQELLNLFTDARNARQRYLEQSTI